MAKAAGSDRKSNLKAITDCMYFTNGHCKLDDRCQYRHCTEAAKQTNNCFRWPKVCRNVKCPYRHPAPPLSPTLSQTKPNENKKRTTSESATASANRQEGFITFFWDIENVPIPRGQKPFDIVQRIRQKLVVESGLREYSFTCYCNSTTISQDNQLNLFHANVRIVHVPDRKPGAVDRQIMLELDRFERAHRPPATIVLISGDIDFVGKLSDLRHQAGFHVIVIHNKPAKPELKATVNAHYPWEFFTASGNHADGVVKELNARTPQPYRLATPKNNENLYRVDTSPTRRTSSATGKKPTYQCPKCTNEFDSIQALRQHQEAKDHLFNCPTCTERFSTPEGQTQHQKAKGHYAAQFSCPKCKRQFTKHDSLVQHQQSTGHDGLSTRQNRNNPPTDSFDFIIQQGIPVLVEYLPKIFGAKK